MLRSPWRFDLLWLQCVNIANVCLYSDVCVFMVNRQRDDTVAAYGYGSNAKVVHFHLVFY